jgi:hypothetical protein
LVVSALEAFGNARLDGTRRAIGTWFEQSGPYLFVISFSCAYDILNAPNMLGHLDLGWHLAAGDLIRERGTIPFQIPGRSRLATGNGSTPRGSGM